ncbi:MAG: hypothetical protein IH937_14830 [Acidobacteria bacterium]|nr:hypothetical protein [Acidobacteriota bacterium]
MPSTMGSHVVPSWEGVFYHLYSTEPAQCYAIASNEPDDPYSPFDQSGMRSGTDWDLTHTVDFFTDKGREASSTDSGGDEYWGLGHFLYVFNNIASASDAHWTVTEDSSHCNSFGADSTVATIKARMGL